MSRKMNIRPLFVFALLALCCFQHVYAKYQSHESLEKAVVRFLKDETQDLKDAQISVGNFDRRLKLHLCDIPLEVFWPMTYKRMGSTTVGIRCNGTKPWKIFVGAYIHIYKSVWVSKTGLHRNQLIHSSSIIEEKRDITRLSGGYLLSTTPIVGMQVKRNILANQVLTNNMMDSKKLIKRGDRITIISKYGGIFVQATGIALSDGSKGERIRVKNMSSKREIEAYVSDKQRVLVTL